MAGSALLEKPFTAVTEASTHRLVQRNSEGQVLWVSPVGYGNRPLADRAARALNERRPRPDQWWVTAPEGRPA